MILRVQLLNLKDHLAVLLKVLLDPVFVGFFELFLGHVRFEVVLSGPGEDVDECIPDDIQELTVNLSFKLILGR